jgi:hypothetical protein
MRRARIHEHERLRRLGRWLLEWRARLTRTLTQELYSVVTLEVEQHKKRRSQPVAKGWDSLIRARRHILARALRGSGATGKAPGTHDLQPRTFLNLYKIAHSRIRRWTKGITRLQILPPFALRCLYSVSRLGILAGGRILLDALWILTRPSACQSEGPKLGCEFETILGWQVLAECRPIRDLQSPYSQGALSRSGTINGGCCRSANSRSRFRNCSLVC